MTGAEIVGIALSWVGTPFHPQATSKGVGCDCAGLIRGVAIEAGLMPPDIAAWPNATDYLGYGMEPDGVTMQQACDEYLERCDALAPGVFVLCAWSRERMRPRHMGIIIDATPGRAYWVHAEGYRRKKVTLSRLMFGSDGMHLAQAYKVPGVACS